MEQGIIYDLINKYKFTYLNYVISMEVEFYPYVIGRPVFKRGTGCLCDALIVDPYFVDKSGKYFVWENLTEKIDLNLYKNIEQATRKKIRFGGSVDPFVDLTSRYFQILGCALNLVLSYGYEVIFETEYNIPGEILGILINYPFQVTPTIILPTTHEITLKNINPNGATLQERLDMMFMLRNTKITVKIDPMVPTQSDTTYCLKKIFKKCGEKGVTRFILGYPTLRQQRKWFMEYYNGEPFKTIMTGYDKNGHVFHDLSVLTLETAREAAPNFDIQMCACKHPDLVDSGHIKVCSCKYKCIEELY